MEWGRGQGAGGRFGGGDGSVIGNCSRSCEISAQMTALQGGSASRTRYIILSQVVTFNWSNKYPTICRPARRIHSSPSASSTNARPVSRISSAILLWNIPILLLVA